ncbi:NAD(P)-dependent oxidoreductase [Pseudonocardia cypriaca]|uniref:3-hydroxyisobutyrate dehydrogenase-like beta-hydroxyacid dehydrogenase n=1 Tax=Pseudonocardia cypriaca TaxID=882449 RepID=A0A543FQS5_9PSEU|nr:NAD(P)-binding domain-containing protein [Pseudonocardia cypriaca]TQM36189.1 3-hydroxyisobutyrate dehydrogenase-like beta-hydroxyacid dehydrogenase [Pseudonocardia cypriaca]
MSQHDHPSVTVIGLGAMGSRIAEVLLRGGHPTTVWNRTPGRAEPLVAQGAVRAGSVAEAVAASPLVLVCVLDYAAAREIVEPVAGDLAGRTLVHFTTGTPRQAREMAEWAAGHGIEYVDSGMMAIPPMIGEEGARFLYSGSKDAFERYRPGLELLGTAEFFGEDAGLASLYDLALLSAMYGMFAGFFHGAALVGSAGLSAGEFAEQAAAWATAMTGGFAHNAPAIDARDYTTTGEQTIAFNKAALDTIVRASRDEGVAVDLVAPLQELLARQLADGHGAASFARIFEGIRSGR